MLQVSIVPFVKNIKIELNTPHMLFHARVVPDTPNTLIFRKLKHLLL